MRNAATVLGIIQDRGRRGLPLEDLYRQLYNPDLYLRAYGRLYANKGAMTPGATHETVDGMARAKIEAIIRDLRSERHRWTPVRRTYVPKKTGKVRPLGLPSWSDKLLGDVIRSILNAYYDPQFSEHSHGFRPGRGCHTALREIEATWKGTRWFIEGDLRACFDKLDHEVLVGILAEKIHDGRFLRLIGSMLRTGYLEDWCWYPTYSGSPQGGVCSPVLSNVYLDKLDQFVGTVLLPAYNRGERRRSNPAYEAIENAMARAKRRGAVKELATLRQQRRLLPSQDPDDPDYRRLRYVRYADDWLLGFVGPKAEAEEIKRQLGTFLRDELKLELSDDKTLITHAASQPARFLGYDIVVRYANDKLDWRGQRQVNASIGLRLPQEVIAEHRARYERKGYPIHLVRTQDSDFTIVAEYQAAFRGLAQYYLLAQNVGWLWRLHYTMRGSLLKTLACKHKSSMMAMQRKYRATVKTPSGSMSCLRVVVERGPTKKPLVAQFGGIPLRRQRTAVLTETPPKINTDRGNELLQRMLADTCEMCGSQQDCEVHHVRKLADLKRKGRREKPVWVQIMAARQRKTLVVCRGCHEAIHAGRPTERHLA
jgi:group II intron reverse transcriptase/maturase